MNQGTNEKECEYQSVHFDLDIYLYMRTETLFMPTNVPCG
jgi:hypothetical protein